LPDLKIEPTCYVPTNISTHTTPPGQWQVAGLPPSGTFEQAVQMCRINNVKPPNGMPLEEWIKSQNALRVPEFFFGDVIYMNTKNPETARRNAGLPARTPREMMGL
jgi:hypothetical protein